MLFIMINILLIIALCMTIFTLLAIVASSHKIPGSIISRYVMQLIVFAALIIVNNYYRQKYN